MYYFMENIFLFEYSYQTDINKLQILQNGII